MDGRIIDMDLCEKLASMIVEKIRTALGMEKHDLRLAKISQNIETNMLLMLGVSMKTGGEEAYAKLFADRHILSVARKGEAVGILAGQSLVQPMVQGMLKSQHSTGKKQTGLGAVSLIDLNSLRTKGQVIKVHLNKEVYQDAKLEQEFLSKKYEEITVEDILISSLGEAKYKPVGMEDGYLTNKSYVYINYSSKRIDTIYRFRLDPNKLDNAGLTHFSLFPILASLTDVMIVIHPLSTFTFDIVPVDKPLSLFLETVRYLMLVKIKGMEGVEMIIQKSIKVQDIIRKQYYDSKTKKTYVYLKPYEMMNFPIEKLKSKIVGDLESDETSVTSIKSLSRLVYNGKISLIDEPYRYYHFTGKVALKTVIEVLGPKINMNYIVSNNPLEMLDFLGKAATRVRHENIYSEELSDKPLHYQHINTLTKRIFSNRLAPITPTGYIASENTSLDTISYQNHTENLSQEIIKGRDCTTKTLTSGIILGNRPTIGTAYMHTIVNKEATKRVIELYTKARQEQTLFGKYRDVTYPSIGKSEPIQRLEKPTFDLSALRGI